MSHQHLSPDPAKEIAETILRQLGGRSFMVMTGASAPLYAGVTASNPHPWLRLTLPDDNQAGVNRLKVSLMPSDTYRVEFYRQELGTDYSPVISGHQHFNHVYADELRGLFERVTGWTTYLPIIRPAGASNR